MDIHATVESLFSILSGDSSGIGDTDLDGLNDAALALCEAEELIAAIRHWIWMYRDDPTAPERLGSILATYAKKMI